MSSEPLPRTSDSPRLVKARRREQRTVALMVAMACRDAGHEPTTTSELTGKPLCAECAELEAYALARIARCPRMECKSSCSRCPRPCFSKSMRARITHVMRHSGPRMLFEHPALALHHLMRKVVHGRSGR